ncbi:hypothetical protein NDU88_006410 [Pleurodeles waltl]|uniref:Uncharacterized protein n=1 Tax=Pleurodeles waltl TaxID=8319 RepID=A0AAV7L5A8_PLEWA|nr:hypothetical protein NDU88_006410 [Pleurodeles waltl]
MDPMSRLCLYLSTVSSLLAAPGAGHPQPCHILARIGHTVRLGALLPLGGGAQGRIRSALSRLSRTSLLPYNLSLELVAGAPRHRDPESLARWLCQALVAQGVAAVLAFPQSRDEQLQLDFIAGFLEVPILSILDQEQQVPIASQSEAYELLSLRSPCWDPWGEDDPPPLHVSCGILATVPGA